MLFCQMEQQFLRAASSTPVRRDSAGGVGVRGPLRAASRRELMLGRDAPWPAGGALCAPGTWPAWGRGLRRRHDREGGSGWREGGPGGSAAGLMRSSLGWGRKCHPLSPEAQDGGTKPGSPGRGPRAGPQGRASSSELLWPGQPVGGWLPLWGWEGTPLTGLLQARGIPVLLSHSPSLGTLGCKAIPWGLRSCPWDTWEQLLGPTGPLSFRQPSVLE